jgi:hypothetical protein
MPPLAFSLSAQQWLVLARIGIRSAHFALHPVAGATCEFISNIQNEVLGCKAPQCALVLKYYDFVTSELISLVGIT